jgi:hypothetical protein
MFWQTLLACSSGRKSASRRQRRKRFAGGWKQFIESGHRLGADDAVGPNLVFDLERLESGHRFVADGKGTAGDLQRFCNCGAFRSYIRVCWLALGSPAPPHA